MLQLCEVEVFANKGSLPFSGKRSNKTHKHVTNVYTKIHYNSLLCKQKCSISGLGVYDNLFRSI